MGLCGLHCDYATSCKNFKINSCDRDGQKQFKRNTAAEKSIVVDNGKYSPVKFENFVLDVFYNISPLNFVILLFSTVVKYFACVVWVKIYRTMHGTVYCTSNHVYRQEFKGHRNVQEIAEIFAHCMVGTSVKKNMQN